MHLVPGQGIDFDGPAPTSCSPSSPSTSARPSSPGCRASSWPASSSARSSRCARTSRRSCTGCRCATSTGSPEASCSAASPTTSTTSRRPCSRRSASCSPSLLTVVGVLTMMFVISPLLALIALVTDPAVDAGHPPASPSGRSRSSWRSGGTRASSTRQIEEAFTGHALVKVFGRQREVEASFEATNEELYRASFGAQFVSGHHHAGMMFLGNLSYVAIAVVGGLRITSGAISLGDVQAFIQYSRQFTPAADAGRVDGQPAAVRRRLRRARLRAARRRRGERRPGHGTARPDRAAGPGGASSTCPSATSPTSRSSTTSRSSRSPARPSRSSARPAPARPRWSTSHAVLRARRRPHHPRRRRHRDDVARTTSARRSAWCCRTPGCSTAPSATTSPTAARRHRGGDLGGRDGDATSTASCTRCPTATTP